MLHSIWFLPCVFGNSELYPTDGKGREGKGREEPTQTRRRLGYEKYSCYRDGDAAIRFGVVIDQGATDFGHFAGGEEATTKHVEKIFADASVPYKENFGFVLRAKEIIFPRQYKDPLLHGTRDKGCIFHRHNATKIFQDFLRTNNLLGKYASWVFMTDCNFGEGTSTIGMAGFHTCTETSTVVMMIGRIEKDRPNHLGLLLLAHETGHNFGARDADGDNSGIMQGRGYATPDYQGLPQFAEEAASEMCDQITTVLDNADEKCVEGESGDPIFIGNGTDGKDPENPGNHDPEYPGNHDPENPGRGDHLWIFAIALGWSMGRGRYRRYSTHRLLFTSLVPEETETRRIPGDKRFSEMAAA